MKIVPRHIGAYFQQSRDWGFAVLSEEDNARGLYVDVHYART